MTTHHATLTKKDASAYARALAVAEGFLIAAAQAQRLVTYAQLGDAILRATGHQVDGRAWGTFLGDLVDDSFARHHAMLSAVVVRADALTPGEGLKRLAIDRGLAGQDEPDSAVVESGCGSRRSRASRARSKRRIGLGGDRARDNSAPGARPA